MTLRRKALITERAYAVLTELKQGERKWEVLRPQTGLVELELESAVYDGLLAKREEWNLGTISDVIIHAYKLGPGKADGTLGSESIE